MHTATRIAAVLAAAAVAFGCSKSAPEASNADPAPKPAETDSPTAPGATPALPSPTDVQAGTALTERGFVIHTLKSAPPTVAEEMKFYVDTFQFVPNLAGVMAESPALLKSYFALQSNLQAIGSLSPPEDNIVQMSIAVENRCQYCTAGHTMAGKVFFKSPDEQLEALRQKADLPEPKLNALRDFALQVYESQGRVTDGQLASFLQAGYTRQQALDVVANVSAKVMSNFANQLARTPLDDQLKPMAAGLPFVEDRKVVIAE